MLWVAGYPLSHHRQQGLSFRRQKVIFRYPLPTGKVRGHRRAIAPLKQASNTNARYSPEAKQGQCSVCTDLCLIIDIADLHVHTFPRSLMNYWERNVIRNLKLRGNLTGEMARL